MANSQFWIQNFELATAIIFKHFKETQDTHGRFNVTTNRFLFFHLLSKLIRI